MRLIDAHGSRASPVGGFRCKEVLLEQFGLAERDGRLQARARPHLGQIHHGIDQARPPARREIPGHRAQPDASGPGSYWQVITSAVAIV